MNNEDAKVENNISDPKFNSLYNSKIEPVAIDNAINFLIEKAIKQEKFYNTTLNLDNIKREFVSIINRLNFLPSKKFLDRELGIETKEENTQMTELTYEDVGMSTLQNSYMSVSDEYLQKLSLNDFILLKKDDGTEQKKKSEEVARELLIEAKKYRIKGFVFIDEVERFNPLGKKFKLSEILSSSQLATEREEIAEGFINLANFINDNKVNFDELKHTIYIAVRFLDNIIDIYDYPTLEIEGQTKKARKIGLSICGFGDAIGKLGISYESKEAIKLLGEISRYVDTEAKNASSELAKERGVFPLFNEGIFDNTKPLRNASLTCLNENSEIAKYFDVSPGIKEINKEASPEWQVRMQRESQKYTDLVSIKNILISPEVDGDEMLSIFRLASGLGIKILKFKLTNAVSIRMNGSEKDEAVEEQKLSERPLILNGKTVRFQSNGSDIYITINYSSDLKPVEVLLSKATVSNCEAIIINLVNIMLGKNILLSEIIEILKQNVVSDECACGCGNILNVVEAYEILKNDSLDEKEKKIQLG
ncbi:hypothetical protein CO123_00505 [bacterium (Candidatus Howlettbacteria) CG_4_9_14_3_um_filter_37_10]|nr:MAG: hypothetical protein CO123_00505 [bacterium (Candidatus Howlettbacteria) CG_4_9_14_3_um_filter_37_10]